VTQATALEWGHPLITPDGRVISVPIFVFGTLRHLGLLQNNKNRLSPNIYQYLDPQYDSITEGLRHLLGRGLTGPEWCRCGCQACREKADALDNTQLPGQSRAGVDPRISERVVREAKAKRKIAA
jgi:hypothetical protein